MLHGNEEGKKAGEGFDFARLTQPVFRVWINEWQILCLIGTQML